METARDPGILDYLRVIGRRKALVVAAVIAAVAASAMVSFTSTKIYAGRSEIILKPDSSVFDTQQGLPRDPTSQMETEVEVVGSRRLRQEVASRIGSRRSEVVGVDVSNVARTRIIQITVRSTSPTVAQLAANEYAQAYVDLRRTSAINEVVEVAQEVLSKIQQAGERIAQIDAALVAARSARTSDPGRIQNLESQRQAATVQQNAFQQMYDQAQIDASLRSGGVEILGMSPLPRRPVEPTPARNLVVAMMLGLVVGISAALLFEFLDDTVKNVDDLVRLGRGAPVVGTIPALTDWRSRDRPRLITVEDPQDVVSEAYRSLRTSLQFIALRQPLNSFLISSPMAAEGKTTTLANLAVTLARAGRRVICVDCDLRRPRLHEFFGLTNGVGFTSVLLGEHPLSSALQDVPISGDLLRVLASGPLPPNPAELLGTARVEELLMALRGEADIVLVDAPPLLPITDALVLSAHVDGILLVSTAEVTTRRHFAKTMELLAQAKTTTIGVVLNGASPEGGYGTQYRYRYTSRDGRGGRRERTSRPEQGLTHQPT